MARLFKIFANTIFILIIIVLSGYIVLRITNRVEIYNVKTGSMEEKIHVGDYILILRKKHYNVGDVVTYTSNNGFITHRIISIDGNTVITKGDANNTEDDKISASTILGKVILSGSILNVIINYKYVLAGFFLSLYFFSCYFDSRKEEKNDDAELNSKIDDLFNDKEEKNNNENIKSDDNEKNTDIEEKSLDENNDNKEETINENSEEEVLEESTVLKKKINNDETIDEDKTNNDE